MQLRFNKLILAGLVSSLFLYLNGILFAQEQGLPPSPPEASPPLDAKVSQAPSASAETPAAEIKEVVEARETLEIKTEDIEKILASYKFTLKQLLAEAEKNIKKANEDIKQEEVLARNRAKEAEIRGHFEKGNALYQQGKFKEAKKEWEKSLSMARQPELRQYVQESERIKYKEEARKKEAVARQIAPLYTEAIYNFNLNQFDRAREVFNQILSLDPAQAKAREYLDNKIPAKLSQLQEEEKRQRGIREEKELKKLEREEKEGGRLVVKKQPQERPLRQKEKPAPKEKPVQEQKQDQARLEKQRKEEARRQRREQARLEKQQYEGELAQRKALRQKISSLYEEALSYYASGRLEQAEDAFNQILSLDPAQAKAREYLDNKIPAKLSQIQEEEERQEERARKEEARRQRQEDARLKKERRQQELEEEKALRERVAFLCKQAASYYNSDRLLQSKEVFLEVLALDPENRQARDYLDKKIPARVKELRAGQQKRRPSKAKR